MGMRMIRKANDLVEAKCMLGLLEQKVMNCLISQIKYGDEDFKEYEISAADFCKETGCSDSSVYEQLRKIGKSLTTTSLYLQNGGTFSVACWASEANYHEGEGRISFRITPALKPLLLGLTSNFTMYDWDNIRQLRSVHAMRIYELLKQYSGWAGRKPEKEKEGGDGFLYYREFEVRKLKEMLGVGGNYKNYHSFKDFVIEMAQKELLEKCDICFTFKEIRKCRRVDRIRFDVFENPNYAGGQAEEPQPGGGQEATPKPRQPAAKPKPGPAKASARVIPMPQQAARTAADRKAAADRRAAKKAEADELKRRVGVALSFFEEEDISISQRVDIYNAADGDVDLIRHCYFDYVKQASNVEDVPSLLIWAVRNPNKALQKAIPLKNPPTAGSQAANKNRFINFDQRKNDYKEWERLELEQQLKSTGGTMDNPVPKEPHAGEDGEPTEQRKNGYTKQELEEMLRQMEQDEGKGGGSKWDRLALAQEKKQMEEYGGGLGQEAAQ